MAEACFEHCPRICAGREEVQKLELGLGCTLNPHVAQMLQVARDGQAQAERAAAPCDGPIVIDAIVPYGFFRRRRRVVQQVHCQAPED